MAGGAPRFAEAPESACAKTGASLEPRSAPPHLILVWMDYSVAALSGLPQGVDGILRSNRVI